MKHWKRNGFTLLEALVALFVSLMVRSMCLLLFRIERDMMAFEQSKQDQLAILQIRQRLAMADEAQVQDGTLSYLYNHEEILLEFDKNRLVKREGYEILMEGIEDAVFVQEDRDIYLIYTKKKQSRRYQIR